MLRYRCLSSNKTVPYRVTVKHAGLKMDQKMSNGTACSCVVGVLCVAWIVPIQGAFISLNSDCKEAAIHLSAARFT